MIRSHTDCIVLGGGPAGLTAAYRMLEAGFSVVLLEKEGRIGGRVKSGCWGDRYWYNLGTQFLVGKTTEITPTHRLADELSVQRRPFNSQTIASFENGAWTIGASQAEYGSNLKWPLMAKLSMLYTGWRIRLLAERVMREAKRSGRRRLQERLDKMSFSDVLGKPHPIVRELFEFIVNDFISHESHLISGVQGVLAADIMRTLRLDVAVGGNEELPLELGRRLGNTIHLGSQVISVVNREGCVEVSYLSGEQKFTASSKYVVAATPADSLAEVIKDLPEEKRRALAHISYGSYVTCAFLTNEENARSWDMLSNVTVHGNMSFNSVVHQSLPARESEPSRQQGGILLTLAAAGNAKKLLQMSDEDIIKHTQSDLYKMFPDLAGCIERVIVQRWNRGIPALKPGAYSMIGQMAAPLGRIHFCGDYLTYGPADMNAAIASGEAAATLVINKLRGVKES